MPDFPRPTLVISRCIDFDACRYNGQVVRASLREELEPHVTFNPICPELEIGLGVPRDPIRMVVGAGEIALVQPSTGLDLSLRTMLAKAEPAGLVRFHARNKLLLMAYDEARLRRMGRIVANAGREPLERVTAAYEAELAQALARPPRRSAHSNVLMHALGHCSDGLGHSEKARFLDALGAYRKGRLPVSALQEVLLSWSARFGNGYLADQTYLAPFPPELVRLERTRKRRHETR